MFSNTATRDLTHERTARSGYGERVDTSAFWTVVGAVAGVVAVIIGLVTYLRANPKRRIEYSTEAVRLLSSRAKIEGLEVKVRNLPIPDPHLVTLRLRSNSRADIPSSSFDGGKDLVFRVEPGGALLLSSANDGIRTEGSEGLGFEWARFPIPPQLIKKRATGTITFVSAGEPVVAVEGDSPLIDIDVREVRAPLDPSRRVVYRLVSSGFSAALASLIVSVVTFFFSTLTR